jgi:hypothetical protein
VPKAGRWSSRSIGRGFIRCARVILSGDRRFRIASTVSGVGIVGSSTRETQDALIVSAAMRTPVSRVGGVPVPMP